MRLAVTQGGVVEPAIDISGEVVDKGNEDDIEDDAIEGVDPV